MRRLIARSFVLSIVAVAAASTVARAQRGGGAPPFGGPRPEFGFDLSDGEPVSFYLEWGRVLELTPDQKNGLIEIRRRLRLQNAPFMHQLDSLRELSGVDLGSRRRVNEDDREALRRFQLVAAPVMDSIKVNNDGARREIGALLDPRQAAKADSLAQAMRDPRNRRNAGRDERGPGGRRPGGPNEQRAAAR